MDLTKNILHILIYIAQVSAIVINWTYNLYFIHLLLLFRAQIEHGLTFSTIIFAIFTKLEKLRFDEKIFNVKIINNTGQITAKSFVLFRD